MKKLLLCFLILVSFSSYASDLPGNPVNDTKAQSLKRMQQHFKNQDNYDLRTKRAASEMIASVSAGSDGRKRIEQTLIRQGILEDGSKATMGAKVSKPVDTAKVAKTLTERLKNAKTYAKNLGKASIPSFVGMAAFHGLMEGIGWVIDEGGQVTKEDTEQVLDKYSSPYLYQTSDRQGNPVTVYDINAYCSSITPASFESEGYQYTYIFNSASTAPPSRGCQFKRFRDGQEWPPHSGHGFAYYTNPDYNGSSSSSPVEVSDSEIEQALKNALESNNAALAAAIAGAITAGYTYDKSEGQNDSSNSLVYEGQNDAADAIDKAFDNPTPSATPEKPAGYYKITDGEKTVEGYVTPAPVTGTTDSTTTPVLDPVTGQPTGQTTTTGGFELPPFCDWAGIVCDWIEWTKEPYEDEEEFETPIKEIEKKEIKKDLVNASAPSCPADIRFDVQGLPFGISIDKSYQMQPICNTVEPLKYVFQLITFCMCAFMLLRV